MTDELEQAAHRIADRGRDALLARLRPAFEQAAARYEDVVDLGAAQLDRMVEGAADRADGLQWRRALAGVATEELGIGLGEALSHPAVQRAQAIVGAPSYEESLAALTAGPPPPPRAPQPDKLPAVPPPAVPADHAPPPQPPALDALDAEAEATPDAGAKATPDAGAADAEPAAALDAEAEATPAPALPEPGELEPQALRLAAVHMGGIGNLASGEGSLELRFSDAGLDIVRTEDGSTVGRLTWEEIDGLDVPSPASGLRRRRRRSRAQLVVRTERGEAQFEIPGITDAELSEHLAPMLARTRGAGDSD